MNEWIPANEELASRKRHSGFGPSRLATRSFAGIRAFISQCERQCVLRDWILLWHAPIDKAFHFAMETVGVPF